MISKCLLGYRYWKQHGINIFSDGVDAEWFLDENDKIQSKTMNDDIDSICKMYPPLTREILNEIIGKSINKDISRTMGNLGKI